jgi:hypothetical protein
MECFKNARISLSHTCTESVRLILGVLHLLGRWINLNILINISYIDPCMADLGSRWQPTGRLDYAKWDPHWFVLVANDLRAKQYII